MLALRIICQIDGLQTSFDGQYIKKFDPNYHNPTGYDGGLLETTSNRSKALEFSSLEDALALWWASPDCPCHCIRPWDGKPNRPLTAFTCEIVDLSVNNKKH